MRRVSRGLLVALPMLVAFSSVGLAGGASPSGRDRVPPSVPSGIRLATVPDARLLVWDPSRDKVGVAEYDVYVGAQRARVTSASYRLSKVPCGRGPVPVRIVAVDRAKNRSRPARAVIQPSCTAASRPADVWSAAFETGDESQWDFVHRFAPERFEVVKSDGGVVPRQGSYMVRVEVRPDEPTSWTSGANAALAEKNPTPGGLGVLGADAYVGFSVFLPQGFAYVPNQLFNHIFEWHGNSNVVQASVHLLIDTIMGTQYGITNPSPGFVVDLHTERGFRPALFRFGDLVTGRWVDFVIHTKWATDSSGLIEGWMDGVKKFSSYRKTWYSNGEIRNVKPQIGYYRANYSRAAVLYLDAFRLGTSYEAVAP